MLVGASKKTGNYLGVFIFVCIKMFVFLSRSVYFMAWDGADDDG